MTIANLHKHLEALESELAQLKEVIATGSDAEAKSAAWRAEELECEIRQVGAEIISQDSIGGRWYDYGTVLHEDGSETDAETGELVVPPMSDEDRESLEAFGMTADECFEQGESDRWAERHNEYAMEGITNY